MANHFLQTAQLLNQVLEFLNAHRDTIVILLKVDLDDISLAVVDEINLVVSICTAILPLVPKSELVWVPHPMTLRLLTTLRYSSHLLDMVAFTTLSLLWLRPRLETRRGPRASDHQQTQNFRTLLATIQSTTTKQGSG